MSDRIKKSIQALLQQVLGFETYLFLFSLFIQNTMRWNPKEGDIRHFLTLIREGDTVLDIGANIGIMTSLIAKTCTRGKVYAIEPIAENARVLKRMVGFHKFRNVEVMELALGDRSGQLEMRMPIIQGVKMQGLTHVFHPEVEGYNAPYHQYQVDQKTLDELFADEQVNAIKMDVENFEYFVLKGGKTLLTRCRPILYLELWENENRDLCFDLLQKMGYHPFVHMTGKLVPYDPTQHSHQNFFFRFPD